MRSPKRQRTDDDDDEGRKKKKQLVAKRTELDRDLGENWRDECIGIFENHAYALKKNILTDVTFLVGPDSVAIHAHRLILALGSPVFEAMFFGGLAEKGDTITIPDVSANGFRHLLSYLYSEDITFTDEGDAFETFVAADKYCVTNLKIECEKCLNDSPLSSSNIWLFLENSILLNSLTMNDRCVHFLKHNAKTSLRDSNFLQVNARTVENLLSLHNLCVSEAFLVEQVIKWAIHKSTVDETVTFKSLMTPLLSLIQFGALTPSQFIKFSEDKLVKELLTDQDSLSILKHICEPEICKLPEWCCQENNRFPILKLQIHKMKSKSVQTTRSSFYDYSSSSSSSSSSTFSSSSYSD